MKKFIIALVALMGTMFTSANAMSYEHAREQALFLTDKMAYELNLNEMQYEAAYEINLDYLLSINTYDDLYSSYWVHRNTDFRHILFDWQYNAYIAASYFYRPLWWDAGCWHFGIYARYPHRTYFYFGRPAFYTTYHGGHSWHVNGGRSWYSGRNFGTSNHGSFRGMRDGWNRGDYRGGHENVRSVRSSAPSSTVRGNRTDNRGGRADNQVRGNREQGTMHNNVNGGRRANESMRERNRESSTRTTVNQSSNNDTYNVGRRNSEGFTPSRSTSTTTSRGDYSRSHSSSSSSMPSRSSSFSGSRGGSNFSSGAARSSSGSSSFGGGSRGGASHGGGSHGGSSHGGGFSGRR